MIVIDKTLELYKNKREMTILQGVYLAVALFSLTVAGVLALIDQSVGQSALIVPLIAMVAFCFNTIAWALIKMVLDSARDKRARKK